MVDMIADATAWVDDRLAEAGLTRTAPVELFRERPWATVCRALTTGGMVWLKLPARQTAFEVGLYALLERVAPEHILVPLGTDVVRGRLLLPDGGPRLADVRSDRIAAMEAVLPHYAELQRAVAPHVGDLLAAGVWDMRAPIMAERFDAAVAAIPGGELALPARERFAGWCEELAGAPGEPTIDHNDLHDHNVLVAPDGVVRFYDWGDSVVGHPFASLLVALGVLVHAARCAIDDPRILRV